MLRFTSENETFPRRIKPIAKYVFADGYDWINWYLESYISLKI